jgi:hypothetical protein
MKVSLLSLYSLLMISELKESEVVLLLSKDSKEKLKEKFSSNYLQYSYN